PLLIGFGRKYCGATAGLGHGDGHQTDGPATRHQYGSTGDCTGQHGVDGVPERIENGTVMFGDTGIQFDDVGRRNFHKLRECAILIDPDDPQVLANVRLAHTALMAMPTVDVHFRADEVAHAHGGYFISDAVNHATKLVPQGDRWLDAPLRPAVPSIYM